MNIWFISKYASHPKYAKAPPRLFYLAREASKMGHVTRMITSNSNHFTTVPDTGQCYNYDYQDFVEIIWIDTKKYKKTASIERLLSWFDFEWKLFRMPLISKDRPDVVIVSSLSILTILYGSYLKRKFGSLLVFEIRDIWPLTLIEEGGFSRWHPLSIFLGAVEYFGYMTADLIVGTMPNLRKHVENRGFHDKRVFCSPLGFDSLENSLSKSFIDNPFRNLTEANKFYVGYAGSMGISNGLDILIEVIKSLRFYNKIHFLIVGSGDLKNKYERDLIDNENVTFLSRIEHKYISDFLQVCDVLYLSTNQSKVWEYGQSMNKVVDYMLAAKPIIASYNGFPSMINEASCGVFVNGSNPDDLRKVFLEYSNFSSQQLKEIGLNGRKWLIQNRSYEKLARDYISHIEEFFIK
jgi:glycosyltransferase involved in cell wall biosynthesis